MRVRMFAVISVVIAGTIVVRAAEEPAGAPVKPQWQTVKMLSGEVVIFGNVKRAGFYATPKDGMSLKQLVSAAGGVK